MQNEKKKSNKINVNDLSFLVGLLGLIISIIVGFLTYHIYRSVDRNTIKNLNINYQLQEHEKPPLLLEQEGAVINVFPYMFNLNGDQASGEYLKRYFIRIDSEKSNDVVVKEIPENGTLVYFDLEITDEKSYNYNPLTTDTEEEADIKIFYANVDINTALHVFHIILVGYDGSKQIFTIVCYPSEIITDTLLIEGKEVTSNFLSYNREIITDYEIYDTDKLNDIIVAINNTQYKYKNPYSDFKELQEQIILEREKIREALEK